MKRFPVEVVGVEIGSATQWDEWDDWGMTFYDFEAIHPGFAWAHGKDLSINFITGTCAYWNDVGDPAVEFQFMECLKNAS